MRHLPMCFQCKHFLGRAPGEQIVQVCRAFPEPPGIPDEILLHGFDHHQPFPGDHGIRFEPTEAAAAERADDA